MGEQLTLAGLTEEKIREIAKAQRAKLPTSSGELPKVAVGPGSVLRDPITLRYIVVVGSTDNQDRVTVEDIGLDPTRPISGIRRTIDFGQQNVVVYADWEFARLQPIPESTLPKA